MGNLVQASVPAGSSSQQGFAFGPNMGTLQYAVNAGKWWQFWFERDAGGTGTSGHLKMFAKYSSDLITWNTPSPSFYECAGTRVSYNQWCVTYQNLGAGNDVIYITRQDNFNASSGPWYDRFTLGASSWTRTNGDTYLTQLDGSNGFPDAVTLDSSGYPVVGAPGNVSISPNQDTGSSWTAGWGTAQAVDSRACGILSPMTSRSLLSIGVNVFTVGNYYSSYKNGGTWGTATSIFALTTNTGTYPTQMAAVQVNYLNTHAIECNTSHAYGWSHRIFNGTSWADGGSIPAFTPYVLSTIGPQMALVTDGTNLYLFTVDPTTYDIDYVKYDGVAGTWGSWTVLDAGDSTNVRINLCGCQQSGPNPAISYIQANGSNYDLRVTYITLAPILPKVFFRPCIAYRDIHFSEIQE